MALTPKVFHIIAQGETSRVLRGFVTTLGYRHRETTAKAKRDHATARNAEALSIRGLFSASLGHRLNFDVLLGQFRRDRTPRVTRMLVRLAFVYPWAKMFNRFAVSSHRKRPVQSKPLTEKRRPSVPKESWSTLHLHRPPYPPPPKSIAATLTAVDNQLRE